MRFLGQKFSKGARKTKIKIFLLDTPDSSNATDSFIHLKLVRAKSGIGVKLNGLDNPATLRQWVRFVAEHRTERGVLRSEVSEFARLLTETGFLKGGRRRIFGHEVSQFLPPELVSSNPMLHNRFLLKNDEGEFCGHLSLTRLTDNAWIFHEGLHRGDTDQTFGDIVATLTQRANELINSTAVAPRYVLWLWDPKVRSTESLSKSYLQQSENQIFKASHTSITANQEHFPSIVRSQLIDLHIQPASVRSEIYQRFDPVLVEVFSGGDGLHPRLNAELASLGNGHVARTVAIGDEKGVWGLAYRLSSYYALNASGMLNTVFLVVHNTITANQLLDGLARLVAERFSFGTDDVALIFDKPLPQNSDLLEKLVSPKPYNFMVVDVLLNKVSVTLDDPAEAEKKRKKHSEDSK